MAVVDSDFRRMQDELAAMAAVVARIQEQFLQTALQAEDRTRHLQARVDELESEKLAQASEMRSIQARNVELLRIMESKRPELSKVIDARNAALRKLAHARRVIRDLVNEGKMISGSDDGIEDEGSEDSEDGSDLSGEGDSTEERSVWCPSDDEETVRPKGCRKFTFQDHFKSRIRRDPRRLNKGA
ncbi:hypothetical protein A0H81_03773 [Grifola frondosa]|uniref:Uncharacterized protein n=1 Tax=Grifola frondosa TaxID=5627 RepID=A0A1C7MKW8_GRIFR|nr:hypothetical protein A0H81_03773 [Grifola frondosa]